MVALTSNFEKFSIRRSSDNLGTVRDIVSYDDVNDETIIRKHIVYDSFGNVTDEEYWDEDGDSITSTHAEAVDQLFFYTGRAFDEVTGLQNNLNRWFDPTVGRWLSEDPIGFAAGDPNVYRYVGNFSTGAADPDGLARITKIIGGAKVLFDEDTAEWILKNGKRVKARNAKFIGKIVSLRDVAENCGVSKKLLDRLHEKYGKKLMIAFDDVGIPDLSKFSKTTLDVKDPFRAGYGRRAWKKLQAENPGLYEKLLEEMRQGADFHWHHSRDGSLHLVDADLHRAFQHTGSYGVVSKMAAAGAVLTCLIPGYEKAMAGDFNKAATEVTAEVLAGPSMTLADILAEAFDWFDEETKPDPKLKERFWNRGK